MLSLFPFFETKSNISWPRALSSTQFSAGPASPGLAGAGAEATPLPRHPRRGHLLPAFLDAGARALWARPRVSCPAAPPAGPSDPRLPGRRDGGAVAAVASARLHRAASGGASRPPLSGRREGAWAWRARPRAPPPRRLRRGRPLPASLGGEDKDGAAEGGEAVRVAKGGTMRGGKGGECSCLFLVFF